LQGKNALIGFQSVLCGAGGYFDLLLSFKREQIEVNNLEKQ